MKILFFRIFSLFILAIIQISICSHCSQSSVDGTVPSTKKYQFFPATKVEGFYQWENNNGYCGEVSMLQAAMAYGQWIDQFNSRCIATPYSIDITQTGNKNKDKIEFLAQILLDDFAPFNTTTGNSFAKAADHFGLISYSYDSATQKEGLEGYIDFISFIKKQIIKGCQGRFFHIKNSNKILAF